MRWPKFAKVLSVTLVVTNHGPDSGFRLWSLWRLIKRTAEEIKAEESTEGSTAAAPAKDPRGVIRLRELPELEQHLGALFYYYYYFVSCPDAIRVEAIWQALSLFLGRAELEPELSAAVLLPGLTLGWLPLSSRNCGEDCRRRTGRGWEWAQPCLLSGTHQLLRNGRLAAPFPKALSASIANAALAFSCHCSSIVLPSILSDTDSMASANIQMQESRCLQRSITKRDVSWPFTPSCSQSWNEHGSDLGHRLAGNAYCAIVPHYSILSCCHTEALGIKLSI